ncbi:hypothetical protein D3C76_1296870 [compost metagenome]
MRDAGRGPAEALRANPFVIEHAVPGWCGVPKVIRIFFSFLTTLHRQAEPQPAQRHATVEHPEQRRKNLPPTGNALGLQIAGQTQQEVMVHRAPYLHPTTVAQGLHQALQPAFQGQRRHL